MNTASTQPGDLVLPLRPAEQCADDFLKPESSGLPHRVLQELWLIAEAEICDLELDEFSATLALIGAKLNYGLPPDAQPDATQKTSFCRSLRLPELALAQACALGRDVAWQRFFTLYRISLTQAAIAMTGSATLGNDLAESLYAELYGLRETGGERRSPLASYSGRGSLLGWLRTTLAQRRIDHHRRTRRETSLDTFDAPAPEPQDPVVPAQLQQLVHALSRTLRALAAEDRFLLAAYFLDHQTLLEIARILHVHEATVSRRLKRLVADLRRQLLDNLRLGGLSRRAAEETLGVDPRDLEINLHALLQTSLIGSFSDTTVSPPTMVPNQP